MLSGVRVPFTATQQIAPLQGDTLPGKSEFFPVQCCDLATGGISFLMDSRPTFAQLVIEFGLSPNVTFLAAEVAHCCDVIVRPSGKWARVGNRMKEPDTTPNDGLAGKPMVQVGCRFTRRIPS